MYIYRELVSASGVSGRKHRRHKNIKRPKTRAKAS